MLAQGGGGGSIPPLDFYGGWVAATAVYLHQLVVMAGRVQLLQAIPERREERWCFRGEGEEGGSLADRSRGPAWISPVKGWGFVVSVLGGDQIGLPCKKQQPIFQQRVSLDPLTQRS